MRRLLLLINIICVSIIAASCQNSEQQKTDAAVSTQPSTDSVQPIDTTLIIQSAPPKEILPGPGKIKDTTSTSPGKGTAIIHTSPEQEKIDSIKREKLKGKK